MLLSGEKLEGLGEAGEIGRKILSLPPTLDRTVNVGIESHQMGVVWHQSLFCVTGIDELQKKKKSNYSEI